VILVQSQGSTYIIAEAGVNHNGSLDMARQLIDVAVEAGADAVKFQTFKAQYLVSKSAPKAEYQVNATGVEESQFDMIQKLELDEAAHRTLIAHCQEKGIQFLSTPFDFESVDLLIKTFDLPCLKIPSGEITNGPLLLYVAQTGKPVILSTGMSTLDEVEQALSVIAYGFVGDGQKPSHEAFQKAYQSDVGQGALRENVRLLHCTTEYPAPVNEVNLRAMDTLAETLNLPVGFSDHTEGIAVAIAAAARGAVIIEKHFTLDRNLPGPDHEASLEPEELKAMVRSIREVEMALGDGAKRPTACETKNLSVARKSLVAKTEIMAEDVFTTENLGAKRPGDGVSPMDYWDFLGRIAGSDFHQDEKVKP
jgi:N-acetylneuraminate synthase